MAGSSLDFEKPILELERKIDDLKKFATDENIDVSKEIKGLKKRLSEEEKRIYGNLTAWQRVQLARHPQRPYTLDYIKLITTEFVELHGDRLFGDDKAIIGGFARIDEQKVVIIGQQKGRDTKENLMRNFGCPHPEGYRKAIRLMNLAEKFNLPVVSFIDTPGAYPGIGAEERGQAWAIAYNLREMSELAIPIVVVVIGEGGSGGALGIGVGDRICVLENAYYSVISPEGCASILWRDRAKAPQAAEALKLTAQDLLNLKIIDEIIPEPVGGAHRDTDKIANVIKDSVKRHLSELLLMDRRQLVKKRYEKFRKMGVYAEDAAESEAKREK
ncbi:MAG: acetyl-CoA carboxylase carboxyltransferase subunit alpha [Candidatus Omnitrophica bacterium]|nr:acetyl-CoA carboxylase carboxyltransferase subunit alpha [Candidatus Omnitrophota bacterium]